MLWNRDWGRKIQPEMEAWCIVGKGLKLKVVTLQERAMGKHGLYGTGGKDRGNLSLNKVKKLLYEKKGAF